MDRKYLIPLALLIALQVLDLVVHVATMQIEPLRIASNGVISIGAIAGALVSGSRARSTFFLAAGLYLMLNLLFLAQHGLVNPSTDGLRLALFVFVAGSLGLTYWLQRRLR